MSRRARIWIDNVPRFCEEQSQPGDWERRPAYPKTELAPSRGGGSEIV